MKTNFKGTKGKWKKVFYDTTDYSSSSWNEIHYGKDGECVAEYIHNDYDALLISKAPEMLEMLINIKEKLANDDIPDYDDYENIEQLIKEATEL